MDENKHQTQDEGSIQSQIIGEDQCSSPAGEEPIRPVAPEQVWNVPYLPNPYFTGREELLSQLETILHAEHPEPQAISGLAGIGKTQIALAYAYRHQQDYQAILWSNADTTDALISGFAAFAELLQLPEKDEKDQLIAAKAAQNWLETHGRWLLILDSASDLSMLKDFLPSSSRGHTLLTTCATSMENLANGIEVETLDQDIGALFILHRAGLLAPTSSLDQAAPHDIIFAQELVREMGGLPLALDQAGEYIKKVQCSLSDYLKLYHRSRATLLKERAEQEPYHPEPVAATWLQVFEKIEQSNPAAANLLRMCAFLQPDAIPEEILLEGAQHFRPESQQLPTNPLAFDDAIQVLRSHSLIQRNLTDHLLSVHRLVQVVLKDGMDQPTYRLWAERTVQAVQEVLPEVDHRNRKRYERCLSHAQGCVVLIEQLNLSSATAAQLLHQTAHYLHKQAHYREAVPLYQRALQIRKQALGPEHPDVASSLNNLAELNQELGKYMQAELLYEEALQIWEQALGPEHPDVASALNGLANLYRELGKYSQAEPLYQRALHLREQALGFEHSLVAYPLIGLATLYAEQGKYAQVESRHQRALRIREQALGPDHPDVASPLQGLGILYQVQGKYAQAEPLYWRALQISEQALGPEHPQVAYSLQGLAALYYMQGNYTEAEPLYQQALQIWEQGLGPEHPLVAYTFNGLAALYTQQGQYTQAELLYQRALQIAKQALGPEHPNSAFPLTNLANLYQKQGKYAEAEPLLQRALQIREQALGPQHPQVASVLTNLAVLCHKQGRYAEAKRLYQQALYIREKALGSQHPLTQQIKKNYTSLLRAMR